ncbi:MAG: GDCCVxC domain-containing (seleno)protein [Candidatus Aminicenantales bacterium]
MSPKIKAIKTRAHLKCPQCHAVQEVEMPLNYCQFFFECPTCHALLRPKEGDCCVFCSYADIPCPSKQTRD